MSGLVDVTNHPLSGRFTIETDGGWLHDGEPITHERTWKYFSKSLRADADGKVYLTDGKFRVDVDVMDAPLVVTAIRLTDEGLRLRLHDDTYQTLDPRTIRFRGSAPYCTVRDGLTARFATSAYIQLAEFIEKTEDGFALVLGGERHPLPPQNSDQRPT